MLYKIIRYNAFSHLSVAVFAWEYAKKVVRSRWLLFPTQFDNRQAFREVIFLSLDFGGYFPPPPPPLGPKLRRRKTMTFKSWWSPDRWTCREISNNVHNNMQRPTESLFTWIGYLYDDSKPEVQQPRHDDHDVGRQIGQVHITFQRDQAQLHSESGLNNLPL